jgi:hypothetical protein
VELELGLEKLATSIYIDVMVMFMGRMEEGMIPNQKFTVQRYN